MLFHAMHFPMHTDVGKVWTLRNCILCGSHIHPYGRMCSSNAKNAYQMPGNGILPQRSNLPLKQPTPTITCEFVVEHVFMQLQVRNLQLI